MALVLTCRPGRLWSWSYLPGSISPVLGFQVCATALVLLVQILNVYVHPETGQWFLSWTEPSWKRKWRALGLWLLKTLLEYTCRDSLPVSRPATLSLCNSLGWREVWCQRIVASVERTDVSPSGTLPGWMTPFQAPPPLMCTCLGWRWHQASHATVAKWYGWMRS